jgi:hypothetical protein
MAIYLCRWPNGDFSIVSASNKNHAIELLDEFGSAEYTKLMRMPDCLLDFSLNPMGALNYGRSEAIWMSSSWRSVTRSFGGCC